MLRKLNLFIVLIITSLGANAQFSDIRGEVIFPSQEDALSAHVTLYNEDARLSGRYLNEKGGFVFDNLNSGTYAVEVNCQGYKTYRHQFYLQRNESKFLLVKMEKQSSVLDSMVVYHNKRLDVGGGGGTTFTGGNIRLGPRNDIVSIVGQDAGVLQRGNRTQINGTRFGQMSQLRNGIVRLGPATPTLLNVEGVKVVSAGVPAMYGDFVGGAIEYNTYQRLDSVNRKKFLMRSSSPFNAYHQNAMEYYNYKPLRIADGRPKMSIASSLYFDYSKDANPAYTSMYQLKEVEKEKLLTAPFFTASSGTTLPAANQYTADQFQSISSRNQAAAYSAFGGIQFNWKPSNDLVIRLEPNVQYNRGRVATFSNSLLNADRNPVTETRSGNLNMQVVHQLKSPYNAKGELIYDSSLISKVNYIAIFDYQRLNSMTMDPLLGHDVFKYGHVGSFATKGYDRYEYIDEELDVTDAGGNSVQQKGYYQWIGYQDTALSFSPSTYSPYRSAITRAVLENNHVSTLSQVTQYQGLLNGQNPSAIHGMFYAPGTVVSNYSKSDVQKTSLQAIVEFALNPSRDLSKRHDMQAGMLFEQRKRSYYTLNANALWQLMPQLVNRQFVQPNGANPILSYDDQGMFTDTVRYNWVLDPSQQTQFDQELRKLIDESNGHYSQNAHFIDVNSVHPDLLKLSMFTADELWNNGSSMVGYAGYDAYGNLDRSSRSMSDFINNDKDRFVGAFSPNYTAVWLQDKVVLRDVKLRAGLRVERYDANQAVLRDPYSFYPVKTIAEVNEISGSAVTHPSNLDPEAKVYVDNLEDPSAIVGYRIGSTWYNENGIAVQSPEYLRIKTTNGVIQPYLVRPDATLSEASFEDYTPEVLVLPRLSFSFPITSTALFYSYYDKFAQRPSFGQSFAPISTYYYLENASNTLLPNPALKPAQRTNYQLGFKQALGRRSLLDVLAGYSEIKGDINLVSVDQAYPRSYITYANIDFSTIKSLRTQYQLVLPQLNLQVSYVLQFADGTGSNANSAAALIQANQPNLRSLYPLEYDIRHKWNANAIFNIDSLLSVRRGSPFQHMMLSVFANAQSGTPYTAKLLAVPEAQSLGTVSRSPIKGNPFGARMPWNYNLDISLSKAYALQNHKMLTLQLSVTNLLNLKNIFGVYPYSASPNDDGYLSSPQGLQQVNNELNAQSYIDYYSLKQDNPGHFGQPRIINLTCRASF